MVEPRIEPIVMRLADGLLDDRETGEMAFQQRIGDLNGYAPTPPADASFPIGRLLAGLPVLVVEDDDLSREALGLLLSHYGARVCEAASVEEAVRYLDNDPPALVISDIGLPGTDGFGLIRHIRRRDAQRNVWTPAIAVSGMSPLEGVDPRTAGFDDFLLKPVDIEHLLTRVSALIATFRRV